MSALWVLPPPGKSAWFAKIDWYLNWQLTRGLVHEPRRPSAELMRLTRDLDLPAPTATDWTQAPLMVSAHGRLDAEQCVVLAMQGSLHEWLRQIHTVATRLGVQKLRVFLPTGMDRSDALDFWQKISKQDTLEIEFSSDEDAALWSTPSKKN